MEGFFLSGAWNKSVSYWCDVRFSDIVCLEHGTGLKYQEWWFPFLLPPCSTPELSDCGLKVDSSWVCVWPEGAFEHLDSIKNKERSHSILASWGRRSAETYKQNPLDRKKWWNSGCNKSLWTGSLWFQETFAIVVSSLLHNFQHKATDPSTLASQATSKPSRLWVATRDSMLSHRSMPRPCTPCDMAFPNAILRL